MRISSITTVSALTLMILACTATGQAQETGKRVGEKLDQAGRNLRGGLNKAGQEAKDRFASAKTSVQNMGVESRVYGRIHWDKALNDATIELSTSQNGVITLNGSVANAKAKARALELAQETVGVTEVIDQLGIRPEPIKTPGSLRAPTAQP